jgi:hypothetical protein
MNLSAMNPMQKVALFGAAAMTLPVLAFAFFIVHGIADNMRLSAFNQIGNAKPPLAQADVEKLLGRPASIDASASTDQAVTAAVYHYPGPKGDMKVIFVNGTVFKTELSSPKS